MLVGGPTASDINGEAWPCMRSAISLVASKIERLRCSYSQYSASMRCRCLNVY